MRQKKILALVLSSLVVSSIMVSCGEVTNSSKSVEITNVSYDPTRELYEEYNNIFAEHWKEKTGQDVEVIQSHGGSGKQARSVLEGNEADVVTLALARDIEVLENEGLIDKGWNEELENKSCPYTSTIVFLVRKGNEKNIKDWDDIVKDDVKIITPNPKSSGGACWNFLAAWAYADDKYGQDYEKNKEFVKKLYNNVAVLDSGARSATTTFVENGQGDVLIAWENEAFISAKKYPDKFEIINPSISILAEPPVTVVDETAKRRGTEEVAKEYLEYLYSDEAQEIAVKNYYRPSNKEILNKHSDVFDIGIKMASIDDFGGWDKAYSEFFQDGGVFDEIYSK